MKQNSWNFYNPTKIIFGTGSMAELKKVISNYPSRRNVLLISGRRALRESGYLDKVIKLLSGRKICLLDKVEPNPQVNFIDQAIKFARAKKSELVIGLGGGSVMDTAKVVALLANKRYFLKEVLSKNIHIKDKGLPCLAIPTTAGSGSEVTRTSSVWDKTQGAKLTVRSEAMFPDVAVVDPALTLSLNKYQTAVTGLDALCHAIESYWSRKVSFFSQDFSLKAVWLIFKHLKRAYKEPKSLRFREAMSQASLYAGLAISNTGTTAGHSISYILTARFGITHGLACSLSLPHLIRHNLKFAGRDLDNLARAAGVKSANQLADRVQSLLKQLKLPIRLRDCSVTDKDLELIRKRSYATENMKNNSFRFTRKDMQTILEKML